MKRIYLCLSGAVMLLFLHGLSHAEMARVELHPVESRTLTTQEFLTGGKEGKPVVIAGELSLPQTSHERLPAIVLLHGSGGIRNNVTEWARFLNELGIATFIPDSFTGRGISSVSNDQSQLSRFVNIIDAYLSLKLLTAHPRIDPKRIAVMGFSRGGRAALYASMKRFQLMYGPRDGREFAAYISFYPDCVTTFFRDDEVSDRPIRIFHGSADDWNPVKPCRAYVERLLAKNKDVRLVEYENAHHVFDNSVLNSPLKMSKAQTARNCSLEETDDGKIINSRTQKPFSLSDPCVERGTTMSYDPAAAADARIKVKEMVLEVLKP